MTKSERILLGTLVLLVAIGGVFILGLEYRKRARVLATRTADLELQRAEADLLLAERDLWLERDRWMDAAQPPFRSQREADSDLIDTVDSTIRRANLTTRSRQPLEGESTETYHQVGIRVSVQGGLKEVLGWVYSLQSPEKFRAVREFKLEPDPKDPAKVIANLVLLRWYGKAETNVVLPNPE